MQTKTRLLLLVLLSATPPAVYGIDPLPAGSSPQKPAAETADPRGAESLEARIRTTETRRLAAMVAGDVGTLADLLDSCLRYEHSNGTTDTRESLLEALASGRVRYEAIEPREMQVTFRGPDVAVVEAEADFRVALPDRALDLDLAYEATWNLISGDWKMVAYRSSPLGE